MFLADYVGSIRGDWPDCGRLADRTDRPCVRVIEPGRADVVTVAEETRVAGRIVGDRLRARVGAALLPRCGGQARQQQRSDAPTPDKHAFNDTPCCGPSSSPGTASRRRS